MTTPVYVGMPPVNRLFDVPKASSGTWGQIRCGGPCKDDYKRITIYDQPPKGGAPIKLQSAALDSFKAAQDGCGFLIHLTGSWRDCGYQAQLYRSDSSRYANPDTTAHCRGLAIDVSQAMPGHELEVVRQALTSRGWHQARPADEPWHYSFGIQV